MIMKFMILKQQLKLKLNFQRLHKEIPKKKSALKKQ
jgi:hypothetical protein